MKCNPIQSTLNGNFTRKNNKSFRGMPHSTGYVSVHDWRDAVKYWEMLKRAKYLDVHSDGGFHHYRYIREENYSFLDKLTSYIDKSEFINKYCDFTGFPNLSKVSKSISETFEGCINQISRRLNADTYTGNPFSVLDYGYDPTCSVSLKKALPGSDLDKGYIILQGGHRYKSDEDVVNEFSGELWNELDQRLVSLNHPDTYPNIYTKKQVRDKLKELNEVSLKVLEQTNPNAVLAKTGAVVGSVFLSVLGVPINMVLSSRLASSNVKFINLKNADIINPYTAAEFNRELAKRIDSYTKRDEAKNFAFFIETVEANLPKFSWGKSDEMFDDIKQSPFVKNSNVTQIKAWKNRIDGGYLKQKLRNRGRLESDFNRMSTDTKYELVKDVIKYSSEDQSSRFSEYFKNDDDIKGRYESLLQALK